MTEEKPKVTLRTILAQLERMAVDTTPIDPATWVNGAMRVVALMGDEHTKLIGLEMEFNKVKFQLLEKYNNKVSLATSEANTTEEYRKMREQEEFVDRIEELCRLCKKRSELAGQEYMAQR